MILVPTTTTTTKAGAAGGKGSTMDANTHALAYAKAHGWGPSRTLSALGHPGYGARFARRALELIEAGHGTHEAVYGLLETWDR